MLLSSTSTGAGDVKAGNVAEWFRALTRNPEVPSSSPLLTGHAGVNSLLVHLPASRVFNPYDLFVTLH